MKYTMIDREKWNRKEYFHHYLTEISCTYSMTIRLDITNIKLNHLKLYPTMLYLITKTIHLYEQFRTAFRTDGSLVVYETMSPCYTVFHQDTETFSTIWTEYTSNYTEFCQRYDEDIHCFRAVSKLDAKPNQPENSFPVSMIPWTSFESFHLDIKGEHNLIPIFTIGKYQQVDGRYQIPLAIQVHHAVCDGFHLCRFVDQLQKLIDEERFL